MFPSFSKQLLNGMEEALHIFKVTNHMSLRNLLPPLGLNQSESSRQVFIAKRRGFLLKTKKREREMPSHSQLSFMNSFKMSQWKCRIDGQCCSWKIWESFFVEVK